LHHRAEEGGGAGRPAQEIDASISAYHDWQAGLHARNVLYYFIESSRG